MNICSPAHKFTIRFVVDASSHYLPESKLPCPWFKKLKDDESSIDVRVIICTHYFIFAIHPRQLNGYFLRSIWARIIYYDDFPCKLTGVLSPPFSVLSRLVRTVPRTPSPATTR
jgi:hypothetical protein